MIAFIDASTATGSGSSRSAGRCSSPRAPTTPRRPGRRRRGRCATRSLKPEIERVHADNFGVYGADKVWAQLNREGHAGRALHGGAADARSGAARRCARQAEAHDDRRRRRRPAPRPRRSELHRAGPEPALGRGPDLRQDLVGFVYVAFIIDVFSRMIVGWQASRSLRSDLALDALEQAIWARSPRRSEARRARSITPTAACNICHSLHRTARRDGRRELGRVEGRLATTTRSPSRSTGSTRPNSSATAAPGAASTTSSTPPSNGSTGSTTAASSKPTARSRPPSSRTDYYRYRESSGKHGRDSNQTACMKPGAVQASAWAADGDRQRPEPVLGARLWSPGPGSGTGRETLAASS